MARWREQLSHFLGGEISPRVHGRVDLDLYKYSCEILENMFTLPQGGVMRRPGTEFVGGLTPDSLPFNTADAVRVIPFYNGAASKLIFFIADQVSADKGVRIFQPGVDVGIGDTPLTIAHSGTPYPQFPGFSSGEQLKSIHYAQFGNQIFFTHRDIGGPWAIDTITTPTPTGAHELKMWWAFHTLGSTDSINATKAAKSAPFLTPNTSAVTMTPSVVTGSGTVTASSAIFNASMNNSVMYLNGGYILISGIASGGLASVANMTVQGANLSGVGATTDWKLSAWQRYEGLSSSVEKALSMRGPGAVAFFENRVYYGGSAGEPNVLWGSRTGNVGEMEQGAAADDPYSRRLADQELAEIVGLSAKKTFQVMTTGGEYICYGPDAAASMSVVNFKASPETAHGSSGVQPVRKDNALLFVPRNKRRIRELLYNFQEDSYKAADIMRYAEHMPKRMLALRESPELPEIVSLCVQEHFNEQLWALDSNGGVFTVMRDREQGVAAFSFHRFGGELEGEAPKVLSMCTLPSSDGSHDDIYLIVRRTLPFDPGNPLNCIERINREFEVDALYNDSTTLLDKPVFVDSAVLVTAGSPTTVFDVGHLAESTVSVVADGQYVGELQANSVGEIELPAPASEVIAGFSYRSILQTTNFNMGSVIGSSQSTPKSIDEIAFRVSRTIALKHGPDLDHLEDINFRPADLAMGAYIPLFTGDKKVGFREGWDERLQVTVVQDLPYPLQIEGIFARGTGND